MKHALGIVPGLRMALCGAALALVPAGSATGAAEPLRVVATTSLVGDVVRRVGGDAIELTVLIPPDADPHAWAPRPADVVRMTRADLVFVNGFGLEEALEPILRMPEIAPNRVSVSEGLQARRLGRCGPGEPARQHGHGHAPEGTPDPEHRHTHQRHPVAHGHAHAPGAPDPHVWFDPGCVAHWAHRIADTLSARRPARAEIFAEGKRALLQDLDELDAWIRGRIERIPPERRILASDHASFGYFADRYGFRLAGAVIPGLSTLAQPSARDLARLQTRLREEGVRAVFVGVSANPAVARRMADDLGIRMVRLYTGSLSGPDGPASDYLAFMRTNVERIAEALE